MFGLEVSSFTLDCPTPSAAAETLDAGVAGVSFAGDLHDESAKANTKKVKIIRVMIC